MTPKCCLPNYWWILRARSGIQSPCSTLPSEILWYQTCHLQYKVNITEVICIKAFYFIWNFLNFLLVHCIGTLLYLAFPLPFCAILLFWFPLFCKHRLDQAMWCICLFRWLPPQEWWTCGLTCNQWLAVGSIWNGSRNIHILTQVLTISSH